MISPEILRRFPFFYGLSDEQLRNLAMLGDEVEIESNAQIFEEGEAANRLFLLLEGSIDLFIKSEEENDPSSRRDFAVGEVNPGEIFGLSTLIGPHNYRTTARAATKLSLVVLDGVKLREMMEQDLVMANKFWSQIARSLIDRLTSVRVQLAAAWA